MRRYTARPKRRGVSSYEDTPRPKRSVYLEDTPEKMYNVVSLKRIVKCIFGYHSNFGQRNGPKRGACKSVRASLRPKPSELQEPEPEAPTPLIGPRSCDTKVGKRMAARPPKHEPAAVHMPFRSPVPLGWPEDDSHCKIGKTSRGAVQTVPQWPGTPTMSCRHSPGLLPLLPLLPLGVARKVGLRNGAPQQQHAGPRCTPRPPGRGACVLLLAE